MTAQAALTDRVRALLDDQPVSREMSMFGGRCFMVNEKLLVSALKSGGLLVRVAADRHETLLDRAGAVQAEMGPGRDMGPGWIEVSAESLAADAELAFWVTTALAHNRELASR